MSELLRRLRARPQLATEILLASLFVNVLSLASPIFVIQVLNRYIGYGFDGTLATLTIGMVIATGLLFGFLVVRSRLAVALGTEPDLAVARETLERLTRIKAQVLDRVPLAKVQEALEGVGTIQAAYAPSSLMSAVDMPFLLLFLLAIFLLTPILALLTILAIACTVAAGWMSLKHLRRSGEALQRRSVEHRSSVNAALSAAETVRAFLGAGFLSRIWGRQLDGLAETRAGMESGRSLWQSVIMTLGQLLRVLVYAVGAVQVVRGELSVGGLIGVSILSAKAMSMAQGFMHSLNLMQRADKARATLGELFALPVEQASGTAMRSYSGRLEFQDTAFAYPGAPGPLFESLTLRLEPGTALAVAGPNGSGKTTLVRLVAGLLEPSRGHLLADGVDLRQLAPPWWRTQVMYVPQEPTFLNASYRENIAMTRMVADGAQAGVDDALLGEVVQRADLKRFLDATDKGLEATVTEGGRTLPVGIRKRLALARALAVNGRLAVFDEPTEGLDAEGAQAMHEVVRSLVRSGVTVVCVTRDPAIVRACHVLLDLGTKPVPRVVRSKHGPGNQPAADGGDAREGGKGVEQ